MKENVSELSIVLIAENLITENDAYLYEEQSKKEGYSLYQYLFIKDIVSESDLAYHLSNYYKIPYLNIENYNNSSLPEVKDSDWLESNLVIPIKIKDNILYAVIPELSNLKEITKGLKKQYKVNDVIFLISEETKINKYFSDFVKIKGSNSINIPSAKNIADNTMNIVKDFEYNDMENNEIKKEEEKIENNAIMQNDRPLVEFIQKILMDAINGRVSDIHFEPYDSYYRIRFRQNGELYDTSIPPFYIKDKLTEKIKLLSKMDIENDMPQTGRINLQIFGERDVDLRVSTFPTIHGDKIVMQIQDPDLALLQMDSLGLTPEQIDLLNDKQKEKDGLILFTGASRSGKSLSAYNFIEKKNPQKFNIYSIEKTTSLKIKGINQLLINPNSKLKVINILQQLVYQDSDAILLEDISNKEELEQLVSLSHKGNLIISTYNAVTLKAAILKLINLGMSVIQIVNEVKVISYQVMIAKICQECKIKEHWSRIPLSNLGFSSNEIELYDKTWSTYNSMGCQICNNRKTKGSAVSFQILDINEKLKQLIYENANDKNEEELLNLLLSGATTEIKNSILDKVKKGEISFSEAENYFKKI